MDSFDQVALITVYNSTGTSNLCISLPHRCFNNLITPNPTLAVSKPNRAVQWVGGWREAHVINMTGPSRCLITMMLSCVICCLQRGPTTRRHDWTPQADGVGGKVEPVSIPGQRQKVLLWSLLRIETKKKKKSLLAAGASYETGNA